MNDANELIARLTTAAGIIMEDAAPIAVSVHPPDQVPATLDELSSAICDASQLIKAAQILARRRIR